MLQMRSTDRSTHISTREQVLKQPESMEPKHAVAKANKGDADKVSEATHAVVVKPVESSLSLEG
eukprot:1158700-Pelagomonas_calceolata.AAC.3